MRKSKVALALFLAGIGPAFAIDANSLIMGTMSDWFNAKSDVTQQAAAIMVARDRKAGLSSDALWSCLNDVAIGNTGNQKVAEVAALCMMTMNGGR